MIVYGGAGDVGAPSVPYYWRVAVSYLPEELCNDLGRFAHSYLYVRKAAGSQLVHLISEGHMAQWTCLQGEGSALACSWVMLNLLFDIVWCLIL